MSMIKTLLAFVQEKTALIGEAINYGIFVIATVILAAILQGVSNTQTAGTAAFNISQQGNTGFLQFGTFMGLIALIIVGGYMIRLVAGFLGGGGGVRGI